MEFLTESFRIALDRIFSADPALLHAVAVSLGCTLLAIAIAAVVAVPVGGWLGLYHPRLRAPVTILRIGMSIPTVVIGLIIYAVLSRQGLLGGLDLLYTRAAIVIGEVCLALPLLASLVHGATASLDPVVSETALTLGASRRRALWRALGERRAALAAAFLATFGRCVTELGIALTVGGNLESRTRTLPSTIQLELGRGDFAAALAPGLVLVAIAAAVALITHRMSGERVR